MGMHGNCQGMFGELAGIVLQGLVVVVLYL